MASITKRPDGRWRARYRDVAGKEHAKHFARKTDGQNWLDEVTASVVTGTYVDPKTALTTVRKWSEVWLQGYQNNRPRTVESARAHLDRINATFGDRALSSIRPSEVKAWTVKLKKDGLADSYIYALHRRLSQLLGDAVDDGIMAKSPTSRKTSPKAGKQVPYVATTEQVWALHDGMPDGMKPAILLAAFAGLRAREVVALRVTDVDFLRGIIKPEIQYPGDELKTDASKNPIPIPNELALELSRNSAKWGSETVVASECGASVAPATLSTYYRLSRAKVKTLPAGFRFHDLRHYFASLLIAQGLDVKVVQHCLRHASAKTTLDTYGHMWPDKDESARQAVAKVFTERPKAEERHA